MKHHKIDQNTEEWMSLRMGKFTASSFNDLFMTESTLGFKKAINKVVYEILTGEAPEGYKNANMERGHELEPFAKEAYELLYFDTVQDGGFWEYDRFIGASPDGLIGEYGLFEAKCPLPNTMIQYMEFQRLPKIYEWQIHGQLMCTGRDWCDFMCYHPKLKPIIIRIDRDEEKIKELQSKLLYCISIVKQKVKLLK